MQWPDVRSVLGGVRYAVIGAVATRHYMPERSTQDLDIAVAVSDSAAAREKLREADWLYKGELSIGGSTWESRSGVTLDVVEGTEPWWPAAIAEAQANRDLQDLPILPLRFLVLTKFRSGRTLDVGDVTRMLGQADPGQLEATKALFETEEPGGLEDLKSLIYLGQLELKPAEG